MGIRRRRRGRRTWSQRLLIAFNSVLAIACLGAAGTFQLAREKAADVPVYRIDSISNARVTDTEVRNILLVGTDDSSELESDDPIKKGRKGEHLADTIMILRVDPVAKSAAIMSIPRDTWVPVAPNWGSTKINGALNRTNGPEQLISTIRQNFGISIDNYVEVNLGGFQKIYEALGGIRVYNQYPIKDSKTSLWLPETGCITLDPAQALAYARTRTLYYQDTEPFETTAKSKKWKLDGTSDYGRIARQQDLIKQTAQAAIDKGIRNPLTAYRLVDAVISGGMLTLDDTINADWAVNLIQTFREFPIDQLVTHRLPTRSTKKGEAAAEEVQWGEAADLLRFFRGVPAPGETQPKDVIVNVPETFAGAEDLVGALDDDNFDAAAVAQKGFSAATTAKKTTIRYGDDGAEAAMVLAGHLDLDPASEIEFVHEDSLPGHLLELIPATGSSLTLREDPLPIAMVEGAADIVDPQATTTTTTTTIAGKATTTTTVAGATTTSSPGTDKSPSDSSDANPLDTPTLDPSQLDLESVGIVPFDASRAAACR